MHHAAAVGEVAEQDVLRQAALDLLLNEALHRAGAHLLVVAFLGQPLPGGVVHVEFHLLGVELGLELREELVHHGLDDLQRQRVELDDRVEAVAELRREHLLERFERVRGVILLGEADGGARRFLGAGVGGHHQHDVAEVRLAAVVVRQRAVVHHLQQQVEHFRVRLLHFVEQHHAVRMLHHGLGEQAALVEADVAGRCADQSGDGVPLHVFGHVEAQQFHAHDVGELAAHFRLADAGGPGEQERADWLALGLESGAGELDGRGERVDGVVLAEHHHLQPAAEVAQGFLVGRRHLVGGNAGDLRHHLLHVRGADGLLAPARRHQQLRGAGLVDHVDGLVRHEAVGDVAVRKFRRGAQRTVRVAQLVVALEARLQPLEDEVGVVDVRFHDVDLLEAARERPILVEDAAVFGVGGGAHAADVAGRKQGLQQVRGVHHAAGSRPGADDGVDLVDEEDRAFDLLEFRQHHLEALLEIPPVLRAGQQRAEVQREDPALADDLRHFAVDNALGQPFGDGRLADAGFAHQERVVLAPPAQHLDDALHLVVAPHQRVDLAGLGQFVEVAGEGVERRLAAALPLLGRGFAVGAGAFLGGLGNAVGDVVHHVQAGDGLLLQAMHRVAFLLREQGDQHVGAGRRLAAIGLHVEHGPPHDALEAQGRLRLAIVAGRNLRRVGVDELVELLAQRVDIRADVVQHVHRLLFVEQRQQDVLRRHVFVALRARVLERLVEGDFQIFAKH